MNGQRQELVSLVTVPANGRSCDGEGTGFRIENEIVDTPKFRGDHRYLSVGFRGSDMASSRLIEAVKRQMGQKLPLGTPSSMRAVQLFHIGNRKLSVLSNPFESTARELFPCMYGERMRVSRANAQRDVLRNGEESNRISGYALRVFRKLKFANGGLILIDRGTQSSQKVKDLGLSSNSRQAPPAPRDSIAKRCELKLPARRLSRDTRESPVTSHVHWRIRIC
ncbi:hypothetical protein ALC60_12824 [Trachymyrmex zeteki]|uniref:Uncharacterized protein n=1 Tax=Mycetomoellerius zeteki TaxID=64791 RepID=A0A151WJS8_9HYME|nr:hypothetical protein ALC60_12824 [Trachymyrmex zeteki]